MKLVIAIVQDQDVSSLLDELTTNEFRVTKLASTGGFLRAGNTTLLIGVEDDKLDIIKGIIHKVCASREITTTMPPLSVAQDTYVPYTFEIKIGGATIFILDVERYERI